MANIQCLDILPQKAKTKSDGGGHSQCGWWSKQFLLFFFHDITQIITILPWWWWWNSVFLINYAGANVCASLSVPMFPSPWHMRPITCVKQKVDVKDVEDNIDIHTTVNLLICAWYDMRWYRLGFVAYSFGICCLYFSSILFSCYLLSLVPTVP